MAKYLDVGRSGRTPAKHALMSSIIGKEIGAATFVRDIRRLWWVDLTAGDGVVPEGMEWEKNCSPGILACHARNSARPITVTLYEIQPATYDRLERNLTVEMPRLGYEYRDGWWTRGNARVHVLNASGATAPVDEIGRSTAVMVTNDPNAITDWAMRPTFAEEIRQRAWCFRSVSTMGCNPAGLMRLSRDDRDRWFDLIAQQEATLPRHHDLLLARIERDASKWGYLLCEPVRWRRQMQRVAETAFARHGMTIETAWLKEDPEAFRAIESRLFLTNQERAA